MKIHGIDIFSHLHRLIPLAHYQIHRLVAQYLATQYGLRRVALEYMSIATLISMVSMLSV